jgi:hypothetical protein
MRTVLISAAFWNTVGLLLNLIGVFILWLFAIPRRTRSQEGAYVKSDESDPKAVAADARYDCWAKIGLGVIMLATLCQIVGALVVA